MTSTRGSMAAKPENVVLNLTIYDFIPFSVRQKSAGVTKVQESLQSWA